MKYYFFLLLVLLCGFKASAQSNISEKEIISATKQVIARTINPAVANRIQFEKITASGENPEYAYQVRNGKLIVKGNSVVALCHGFYAYLKSSHQGMITWSGKNLHIFIPWKSVAPKEVTSPYRFHYYMNVVTAGYTTPYWGWNRWQKELDWMALHGMDMLMLNGAYEAIMFRVFKKIGLSEKDIRAFFPGPAFQPWNRMGNLTGWDGTPPLSWYSKQITLTRQVLNRMHELGMTPVIQAFAGFVPKEITHIYPHAKITSLVWNNQIPEKYRCNILLPDSANAVLFTKIEKLFVQEWEKEFGKETYFLADCFNEMQVPRFPGESENEFQKQLSEYGKIVYTGLKEGDTSAVWVMQGWTFGYQRNEWNKVRLSAFVSDVPDNKVLFLDLANEYNLDFWHISPGWQYFDGYFHKQWIYSFIPNMGGKTPWNGILKTYAEAPIAALHDTNKGYLIGFGFAPEGIENNELTYELLSDMGWRDQKIDLNQWLRNYCTNRYGSYPEKMKEAYQCFLRSCYGTFMDHPRFRYQISADGKAPGTVNKYPQFFQGVKDFLSCASSMKKSQLYRNDAIELSAEYLSLMGDSLIKQALNEQGAIKYSTLNKAYSLLDQADRLLQSHPEDRLQRWVNYAKAWGNTPAERQYYTEDARRIITTWAPGINDYSARMWSGLISSYYVQRIRHWYAALKEHQHFNLDAWEEHWVQNGPEKELSPYADPIAESKKLINKLK